MFHPGTIQPWVAIRAKSIVNGAETLTLLLHAARETTDELPGSGWPDPYRRYQKEWNQFPRGDLSARGPSIEVRVGHVPAIEASGVMATVRRSQRLQPQYASALAFENAAEAAPGSGAPPERMTKAVQRPGVVSL